MAFCRERLQRFIIGIWSSKEKKIGSRDSPAAGAVASRAVASSPDAGAARAPYDSSTGIASRAACISPPCDTVLRAAPRSLELQGRADSSPDATLSTDSSSLKAVARAICDRPGSDTASQKAHLSSLGTKASRAFSSGVVTALTANDSRRPEWEALAQKGSARCGRLVDKPAPNALATLAHAITSESRSPQSKASPSRGAQTGAVLANLEKSRPCSERVETSLERRLPGSGAAVAGHSGHGLAGQVSADASPQNPALDIFHSHLKAGKAAGGGGLWPQEGPVSVRGPHDSPRVDADRQTTQAVCDSANLLPVNMTPLPVAAPTSTSKSYPAGVTESIMQQPTVHKQKQARKSCRTCFRKPANMQHSDVALSEGGDSVPGANVATLELSSANDSASMISTDDDDSVIDLTSGD